MQFLLLFAQLIGTTDVTIHLIGTFDTQNMFNYMILLFLILFLENGQNMQHLLTFL